MENNQNQQPSAAAMKVTREFLSRNDLQAMAVGQTIEFCIPADKLESASSTCNNMKYLGKRFSKSVKIAGNESSITVTRIE